MRVDIKYINTEALGAVLAGLDLMGLQELTNVFARWAFELDWAEVSEIDREKLHLVSRCFDEASTSYSIQFTDGDGVTYEFTKRDVGDIDRAVESEHEDNDIVSMGDDVETVMCGVDRLDTDQLADLVSLIRETMPVLADCIYERKPMFTIPKPTSSQIDIIREALDALCSTYSVRIGDVQFDRD